MEKMELEKGKLVGELKQLSLEKEQLNTILQEELDVRKMIQVFQRLFNCMAIPILTYVVFTQVESQKLIADIKSSYEHKISKLKDEIKTKEEVISIKLVLIKDLEKLVKKLRVDIASINGELQKSRNQERENQGKMSQVS
jgi:predicted ribosome quality control (RQC) complex YloA/Tae2 family protein